MKTRAGIKASVLPVVLVISVIMLLIILGLLSLWEMNFLYFSRQDYNVKQRAHIESFFTLYCSHPDILSRIEEDSTFILYADVPDSRLKVSVTPWGLYEAVCVSSLCGKVRTARMVGAAVSEEEPVLWYRNHGSSLTITGKTEITGPVALPTNGLVYGQMQSIFFSGSEIPVTLIRVSEPEMPAAEHISIGIVGDILSTPPTAANAPTGTIKTAFHEPSPVNITIENGGLYDMEIEGKVIISGDKIVVDESCKLRNVILTANYVEISDNVKGVFQVFARDSITVGSGVLLDFPSGLYSENKITIGEESVINGYVINNYGGAKELEKANTVKDRTSKIRGLYYSRSISQVQGIITGGAYIDESLYFTPRGYYRHLLYEAAFIENRDIAYPLWLDRDSKRKVIGWLD